TMISWEVATMTDSTGHMDRPGAGPFSTNEFVDGIPTNHYTHENPETRKIEVVKSNPPGVPDSVVKEFDDRGAARLWIRDELLAGRLG
ncbi:MAG: hypothetical protein ACRD3J_01090, partial [Thermoanaerobaculia bacterium]